MGHYIGEESNISEESEFVDTAKGRFRKAIYSPNLTQGDVIKDDSSWCIVSLKEDIDPNTEIVKYKVTVNQNIKVIDSETGERPQSLATKVNVLDFDSKTIPNSRYEVDANKLSAKSLFLDNKNFLVKKTKNTGGGFSGLDQYSDGHQVTAVELDENNQIKTDGLTVEFFQTGSFNCMLHTVDVVGRMEPTFAPFVPVQ